MKRQNTFLGILLFLLAITLLMTHACKKTNEPVPHNPYDDIKRGDTTSYGIPIDSLTITYLHKKVLQPRCALPGCHVGNFEPDFRTPQSSFSTLVYALVKKNNPQNPFVYRLIPYDTAHSLLCERLNNCCFITQDDRMPQDNIGVALPDSSLNLINSWIMHGARDIFGKVPRLPNTAPVIQGFVAFDTVSLTPPYAFPTLRYDTFRVNNLYYNPFIVPVSKGVFYVAVVVADDSTALGSLQVNKLKISTHADDFTGAWQYTGTYVNAPGFQVWLLTVPTANLPANDTLYMRYYVNDLTQPSPTEFPRNDLVYPYKTFWSFIRQ